MNDDEQQQDIDAVIPILQDVITADELASGFKPFIENSEAEEDSELPEYDEVLLAMRDEIAHQLQNDLKAMIANILDSAIAEAGVQIVRVLHDELDSTLEQRIRYLIEQRLSSEFGPRNQHDPEQD
jgi:hypothetical protein